MKIRHIILIILICNNFTAKATHIVGGGFDIVWLHDSTYELHLRMLRDCINGQAPFNDPLYLGTFDLSNDDRIEVISMALKSVTPLNYISTKCSGTAPPNCVEVGFYTKVITLSPRLYNNNAG